MNKLFIFFFGIFGFLYSCNSAKKIQKSIEVKDTAVAVVTLPAPAHAKEDSIALIKKMYKSVKDNYINFTTFSGKIDLDYDDENGKKYNVNANIRMYKDSVIWVSITAILGLEGLRAFITPDSVKLLDKQDKIYTVKSISFLQEVTGLPLTLSTLQDLLLGNPVFLDSNITSYSITGNGISLWSNGIFFKNQFTIDEVYKLVQSSKLEDSEKPNNRTCYLAYSNYEKKEERSFSTKRSISVVDKKRLGIKMDYKQYTFNEKLSFPFSVPKNYTRN